MFSFVLLNPQDYQYYLSDTVQPSVPSHNLTITCLALPVSDEQRDDSVSPSGQAGGPPARPHHHRHHHHRLHSAALDLLHLPDHQGLAQDHERRQLRDPRGISLVEVTQSAISRCV